MLKRIQGNGSITIPVMLRRSLGIEPRDTMEVIAPGDGSIVIRPRVVECVFCGGTDNVAVRKGVRMCLACYQKINVRKDDRNGRKEAGEKTGAVQHGGARDKADRHGQKKDETGQGN